MKEYIIMVSPLRYPGGKTRACKILEKIIFAHFNILEFDSLISPFIGGGSFEFYMMKKYKLRIIGNDLFEPLWNFWDKCKRNKLELCAALESRLGTIDKNIFLEMREDITYNPDNIERAIQYFIINRCSFSGSTLSGGFSRQASEKRFTLSSIDKIRNLNLGGITFENMDFEKFIHSNIKEGALIYLDPPYYMETKKNKLYGSNGDLHKNFDHMRLYQCIIHYSGWIMTYNDCSYIRNLYKDYIILDAEWSYGMGKSKKSSEIIILSPTIN